MTEQEEQQIADLKEMFLTPGWKVFLEDVNNNIANLVRPGNVVSLAGERALGNLQGQISILNMLVQYEDLIEQSAEAGEEEGDEE